MEDGWLGSGFREVARRKLRRFWVCRLLNSGLEVTCERWGLDMAVGVIKHLRKKKNWRVEC